MRNLMIGVAMLGVAAAAMAETPNLDLWELYTAHEYTAALDSAAARLERAPGDRDLLHLMGRTLYDMGREDEAMAYLRPQAEETVHDYHSAWALFHVGAFEMTRGREDAAVAAWRRVREEGVTRNVARNADNNLRFFGCHEDFADWPRRESEHFVFIFSPATAERGLDEFVAQHEAAYTALTTFFGGAPEQPIRYVVWDTVEEAGRMCGIRDLGFARPERHLIHTRWEQTVGHEMTHVISYQVLAPKARTRLVNEGLAVRFDMTRRDRMALARAAVAAAGNGPPDLDTWWDDRGAVDASVYYPVSGAWIGMLLERGGREKLLALAADQSLASARSIYGDDLEVWMTDFETALTPEDAP